MENAKSLDDDYFIKNAVLCWLHYYGNDHKWSSIYNELAQRDTYTKTQKTRSARRRKKTNEVTELLS